MISIKVDTSRVQAMLKDLPGELNRATRNALNDIARDVVKREQQEIGSVFNSPRPILARQVKVTQKATSEQLDAVVKIVGDEPGGKGSWVTNTLTPHIPGHSAQRKLKAFERAIGKAGFPGGGGYLVPSRTTPQSRAESGAQISKMLNDMGVFKNIDGFTSTTKAGKVKYLWGQVGGTWGIWNKSKWMAQVRGGGRISRTFGALEFLVVQKRPTYRKRFEFYRIGRDHAGKVARKHLALAIEHALRRAARKR
jgi:hypothetical protein